MTGEAREHSFDELTRGMASGSISRGKALRLMGAALVGGTLASLGIGEAGADLCKPNGKACKKGSQCCSGNCNSGTCSACPADRPVLLSNGTCAKPCTTDADCAAGCGCVDQIDGEAQYCANTQFTSPCDNDSDCLSGQFCGAGPAFPGCFPAC